MEATMNRASTGLRLVGAVLIGVAIGACSKSPPTVATSPRAATDDMPLHTLRSEGLDASRIEAGIRDVSAGHYGNIHSLLIFRHGKLVSESYFPGEDENNHNGKIGLIQHGPQSLHDIRSVSKTIVALALLKAHEQGRIISLDQPLFDYFPEYAAR
jgi:CubicO group peptidase (beta-lactamase class C family)